MDKRKIWKTGKGTYVVSLPREWARNQVQLNPRDPKVILFEAPTRILISTENEYKNPVGHIELTAEDPVRLQSQIIAAYISGHAGLRLTIPDSLTESRRKLREIPNQLYGTTVFHESKTESVLSMSVAENSILNIVQRSFSLFNEVYGQALQVMGSIRADPSAIDSKYSEVIRGIEFESDMTFLYGRRLLNKALLFPDVSERVGLKDVRDAIEYSTIFSSFERLTDLQEEIYKLLVNLNTRLTSNGYESDRFLSSESYSFVNYYKDAHEIVETAFISLEDERKALKILSMGTDSFEPFISQKNREIIQRFIENDHLYMDLLLRLEGKISAMIGISTNIVEAGRNLHRPEATSEISKFFV